MSTRMSVLHGSITEENEMNPQRFRESLLEASNNTIASLQTIWIEAGYEDAECSSLLNELLNKVKATMTSELASEERILNHAKEQIDLKLSQYNEMCFQLGRSGKVDADLGTNCAAKFATLEKLLETIEVEISQRESVLQAEYEKVKEVCTCLGEELKPLDSYQAPEGFPPLSDARVELLQELFEIYSDMKKQRIEEMKQKAQMCCEYMKELEILREGWGNLSSEQFDDCNKVLLKFCQTSDWTMGYHKQDVKVLDDRLISLKDEKESRKKELTSIGAEIARLWTLFRIPTTEREAFQSSFKLNLSMETLIKGRKELERLLTVRKTSLKKVIGSIRKDIATLWEEAGIESEAQQRAEFPGFFDDIEAVEDSAVEIHESYYTKLKARVEELKPILMKIARRETIIQERIELEHIQLNPERLTARGPNAREERKREEAMAGRVKNLDKLTKELLINIASWEEVHGPFLFSGEKYIERVNKQEETYIEIRDTLRNSRRKKDTPGRPESSTLKSSSSRKITTYQSTSFTTTPRKDAGTANEKEGVSVDLSYLSLQDENFSSSARNRSNSHGSDATNYTSVTEVRERASTVTVLKSP